MSQGTKSAQVQHARSVGEPRLRAIIDHVADGMVIVGGDGVVRFVNPAAEVLFGRPASELLGQPFGFAVAGGTMEILIPRRGAPPAVVEVRAAPLEWEGEPVLLLSLRDITSRKEAEQRSQELMHEQAARGRAEAEARRVRFLADATAVLDSSLDYPSVLTRLARMIVSPSGEPAEFDGPSPAPSRLADWCVIDEVESDRTIQRIATSHCDPQKAALLSRLHDEFPPAWDHPSPATEALGRREPMLYPTVTAEALSRLTRSEEHAALLLDLGMSSVMAIPLIARGETLGVMALARSEGSYTDADLALATELAQRSALSIANARLYREAREASRAKSNFLSVMSHELRTPLNAIMGYTDLMEAEIPGPINAKQRDQLQRVATASQNLLQIVEEILTFARMESGREEVHARSVDLAAVVDEVVSIVRPLASGKGLVLNVARPEAWAEIVTDPAKTRQILLNLLTNAVKFTEEGSVTLEAWPEDGGQVIRITDTGVGIPAEHLDRVFEPFWQVEQSASRAFGGTGLGLSVAQRLSRLIGGDLSVMSRVGNGTSFTLWLPGSVSEPRAG